MQSQILVVSNPPHQSVDHETVAEILGLSVNDVRLKTSFPAPEVLASSDPAGATEVARALETEGSTSPSSTARSWRGFLGPRSSRRSSSARGR